MGTDLVQGTLRVTGEFKADHGVLIAEGGIINWDNGDVMLIQQGQMLTLTGRNGTPVTLRTSGGITSSNPHEGLGYAVGAGGAVAQAGGKNAEVGLHVVTGRITTSDELLEAGTTISFRLNNLTIGQYDILLLQHVSGGTLGAYNLTATPGPGEAEIHVRNLTALPLAEEIVIAFAVIKAAVA